MVYLGIEIDVFFLFTAGGALLCLCVAGNVKLGVVFCYKGFCKLGGGLDSLLLKIQVCENRFLLSFL